MAHVVVLGPGIGGLTAAYDIKEQLRATDSVTIISASSLDCDALSTICLIKGLEDSMALIESIPDTEAVFITKDDQVYTTLP